WTRRSSLSTCCRRTRRSRSAFIGRAGPPGATRGYGRGQTTWGRHSTTTAVARERPGRQSAEASRRVLVSAVRRAGAAVDSARESEDKGLPKRHSTGRTAAGEIAQRHKEITHGP